MEGVNDKMSEGKMKERQLKEAAELGVEGCCLSPCWLSTHRNDVKWGRQVRGGTWRGVITGG